MDPLFTSLLFGTLGGLVRALVGIAKYIEVNRSEKKLRPLYLVVSLVVAAIVGGLSGALVAADWRFAVIAGYAGADFLEGLYKIRMKQGLEI